MDSNTTQPVNQMPPVAQPAGTDPSTGMNVQTAPAPQNNQYNQVVDEEHYMMRYMPEGTAAAEQPQNGYKEMKGPELAPPAPAAEPATPASGLPPVVEPVTAQPGLPPIPANLPPMDPTSGENNVLADLQQPESAPVPPVSSPTSLEAPVVSGVVEDASTYKNQLDDLLTLSIEKNASDLHIAVGYAPQLRIDGKLVSIGTMEMTANRVEKIVNAILDDRLAAELEKHSDVDFSYPHKSGNRFRVNVFFNKGTLAGAFRLIPQKIRSISELNMPEICYDLIKVPQGLILFTGPTGSGKSTSIAAMIQEINLNYSKHIITIEDPIEYAFPKAKSLVNQREIGQDAEGWHRALRELLRQDPNVVLVGEMRDYETIASTITVAETGHLVFATLHTNSASQTIDRIIDVFPEGQQNQVRSQLANVIVAVIAQRLLPVSQGGRKAVFEVMVATPGIKNAIREGKTYQIDNMIQTNADLGMITLEKSLLNMIKSGDLTIDQAMGYTAKPDELMSLINRGQ